jgi:hypothetical protein
MQKGVTAAEHVAAGRKVKEAKPVYSVADEQDMVFL